MTATACAVLEKAKVLGVSLSLGRNADGSPCVFWRAPKGATTPELLASLREHRADLLAYLLDWRKGEVLVAYRAAYERLAVAYGEDRDRLAEVAATFPDLAELIAQAEKAAEVAAVAYQEGGGSLAGFASALAAWERVVLDGLAALDNARSGRLCSDCGAEAPVTLVTGLGQRICSRCARTDAPKAERCAG